MSDYKGVDAPIGYLNLDNSLNLNSDTSSLFNVFIMHKNFVAAAALLSAVASGTPVHKRDVIGALPEGADQLELKFQPHLDFDSDGCYQTSAIDPNGNVNPGHGATGTPQGDCRDPHQLENSNTYSRKRCNNGFCAVM